MATDSIIGLLDGLRPTASLTVTQWANENVYLVSENSAEAGRYDYARTPYVKEIADCMSPNSPVTECSVMKGVQLALTTTGLNIVGTFMDISPCSIMYIMPTLDGAAEISENRLTPMIENSPRLSKIVRPSRERDSGNKKLVKKFRGGRVSFAGANSAASLRSKPVRVLIEDETDAYPLNLDNEGSPIALVEKRTATFGFKKKIFRISTPLAEDTSVIKKKFLEGDQRYYHVPCPHCGAFQHLKFSNLFWDVDEQSNPINVVYKCDHCDEKIEERFKTKMLAEGNWETHAPEKSSPHKRSYHINSLYSPVGWLSWQDIAIEFVSATRDNDQNALRVFVNTVLGETWVEKGEAPDWEKLHLRSQINPYKIGVPPVGTYFLTAGLDVQKDRIEMEVVGWGLNKRSFSVDYMVFAGNTEEKEVWDKAELAINKTYVRDDGIQMQILTSCIDMSFNSAYVYEFCRRFNGLKVVPIQGRDKQPVIITPPKIIDTSRAGKKIGSLKVWGVGVSVLKSELYGWLRLQKNEDGTTPPGYCEFPTYDPVYFRGITAEVLQFKMVKGRRVYEWVVVYKRNEPLDCRNYARAAATIVGIDRFGDEDYQELIGEQTSEEPTRRRSSFWD